jgi:hypothetical protein
MGLFDTVNCEYPLPEAGHQDLEFQTKDLDPGLDHYTITRDGRLVRNAGKGGWGPDRDVERPHHGDVSIYTSKAGTWIEYAVRFTNGRVEWIRPLEETRRAPGFSPPYGEPLPEPAPPPPALPADTGVAAGPEEALLLSLRRDRNALQKLLEENSSHWGYEDPVYRFYHQSFKVYWLQQQTQAIVDRLQALAPDLPLNPWFVQVVESGTGKEFKLEDNARWTEMTRPILEAFFHARFFLEMAVRYANLPAPPQPLPSGYAALLELFCIR